MPNPLDRIQSYFPDFTKTDKELAVYFINNPRNAITTPISDIVKETKTSKAALSRFAQKLGYSGFSEFRYDVSRSLIGGDEDIVEEKKITAGSIIDKYIEYIGQLKEVSSQPQLEHIAEMFLSSNRIKIFGMNRSFNSALQFKQRLARMGFDSEASSDTVVMTDCAGILNASDLVFIYTTTDNTKTFANITKELKTHGCKIVCITANQNLSFKKLCDEFVVVPRISRDSYFSFLDDQPLFMIYSELMLEAIARQSNLKQEEEQK